MDETQFAIAGFGWRVAARITDQVVFWWLVAFVLIEIDQRLLGGDPWGTRPGRLAYESPRPFVLLMVVVLAFEVIPVTVFGATIGKALFGLRVHGMDGRPVGVVFSVVRAVLLYGPLLFLGVWGSVVLVAIAITAAIPASGRGLHDRVASTRVVALPRSEIDP